MGDRGNIKIKKDNDCFKHDVYFYTHWSGSNLREILASALERGKGRWHDSPYLARIIFSEMIQGSVLDLTGFGIATVLCDNEHPILVVDMKALTVHEEADASRAYTSDRLKVPVPIAFAEFIARFNPATVDK